MGAAPLVSVALASYNGDRYIGEQLRSILGQTRLPDQIVISDGGSTDETVRIAREVLARNPLVPWKLIADGARLGVGANFQRAIGATSGQLIVLSDQDDSWHADRLARTIPAFDDPRVLLAGGNARLVDEHGTSLSVDLFGALGIGAPELEGLRGDRSFALLIRRNLMTGATVAFRRELLRASEPFPSDWVHDEWLAIIAAATGRLSIDPDPLIDYRQHGANAIGVSAPTLPYRIRRMLMSRGDRYPQLCRRAEALSDRLEMLEVAESWRELARRKAEFEAVRAGYDPRRLRRIGAVLAGLRRGSYRALSSQGQLDAARDILQSR
jgi:glycosyltransferase involved in cell wall biosynthesis